MDSPFSASAKVQNHFVSLAVPDVTLGYRQYDTFINLIGISAGLPRGKIILANVIIENVTLLS